MKSIIKLIFGLLLVPASILAQEIDYTKTIPFDSSVKTGKLKNGLTYYIKKNSKPENKVNLRLVVNAGSILENDDQRGLAHFMEHMNFNGTKHFPKNKLVDYLQSIGVKFGQHVNAYTSFDETAYFLPIPSDSPEKLENGFTILEDWAFNANLTPEDIDNERGVVLEEYRLRLSAGQRMSDRYISKILYNSKYADRMPIGKKEIIENFSYNQLISFYKDWYRPDLICVIVVGDIDVAEMEKKIIAHFSGYRNPENERPRKVYEVPNHKETFVAIESDKEASNAAVQLVYKDYDSPKAMVTVEDYKNNLIESLFESMLGHRLWELTNTPTPPFLYGSCHHGMTTARTKEAFQCSASSQEDKQLEALKVLVTENEKVKKFGFTQSELELTKSGFLSDSESRYSERDKTASSVYVGQLQYNFLQKYPVPGIEWKHTMDKKLLSAITLNDVNKLISSYIKEDNRVVILTGPEKETLKPTEQDVLNAMKVNPEDIKPYEDAPVAKSLLRNEPKPGSIVKRETDDKLGSKTLFLSNGAKVTYKKTDFKNDQILFKAVSFGGNSMFSNEELKKVFFAYNFLAFEQAGFSGLKLNDIAKFMAGKNAYVCPYISEYTEELSGWTAPKDLEYLFQMTYAYFTDLNFNSEAFESYRQKQIAEYKNWESNPDSYFQQEFSSYLNKENPRFIDIIPTEKTWAETDYTLAYNKYKERFANAGDFEFYFVGNIDDKIMEDYVCQYIASLPSTEKKEMAIDLGYRMLKGEHKKIIYKGTDPKSKVTIRYYGDAVYDPKEAFALEALGEILTIKLTEELREKESGVYSVGAFGRMNKVPKGSFYFSISFPCGPENVEKLTASALNELQKIIADGPEAKDLAKFKEAELLDFKKECKDNYFWIDNFSDSFKDGKSQDEILQYEEKINALSTKEIQAVANKYLTKDKVIGVLMPEKK